MGSVFKCSPDQNASEKSKKKRDTSHRRLVPQTRPKVDDQKSNFWNLLSKWHFAIIGRRTSKNSVAHTIMNPGSVLEQKLFDMSIYTYWKDAFFVVSVTLIFIKTGHILCRIEPSFSWANTSFPVELLFGRKNRKLGVC